MARKKQTNPPREGELEQTDKTRRKRKKTGFYAESLDVAEQAHLSEALEIEGLDEEIALLRVRLRRALEERPDDSQFLLKSIALLAKLLGTRAKLSGPDDDTKEAIIEVLEGIGGAIWPEEFKKGGTDQ